MTWLMIALPKHFRKGHMYVFMCLYVCVCIGVEWRAGDEEVWQMVCECECHFRGSAHYTNKVKGGFGGRGVIRAHTLEPAQRTVIGLLWESEVCSL